MRDQDPTRAELRETNLTVPSQAGFDLPSPPAPPTSIHGFLIVI